MTHEKIAKIERDLPCMDIQAVYKNYQGLLKSLYDIESVNRWTDTDYYRASAEVSGALIKMQAVQ